MENQELTEKLACAFHENWRQKRTTKDGTIFPRWKIVEDEKFLKKLNKKDLPKNLRIVNGVVEIDIANTHYNNLTSDWQEENKNAAKIVLKIIQNGITDPKEIGSIIHKERLTRHTWQKGTALDVPFEKLPKIEKEKDLDQYRIAIKILKKLKI